jgi:hypothetical protein
MMLQTLTGFAADRNRQKDPIGTFGKAFVKSLGGWIVQDAVEGVIIGTSVSAPVVIVGVAVGMVAADEFGHVIDEAGKHDWAGDTRRDGIDGLARDIGSVGFDATKDTVGDVAGVARGVWNIAATALNVTGEAGRYVGQATRSDVVAALSVTADAGRTAGVELQTGMVGIGQFAAGRLSSAPGQGW